MKHERIKVAAWWALIATGFGSCASAQEVFTFGTSTTTVEGYVNATAASAAGDEGNADALSDGVRIDAALRALVRIDRPDGPDWGLRLVAESSPERGVQLAESSLLVFGSRGRLEIGERQGLPDVLTGYAPNNFTFTSADFGPASGASLDPGGGLPTSFIGAEVAAQIDALATLGFTATLAEDRSTKALYVSPKKRGFLYGFSYAPDADDDRYGALWQAGVTHEWYWSQNVLRVGGSYAHAQGDATFSALESLNVGATLVLEDALSIGVSTTWSGDSGLPATARDSDSAWGATTSINYNVGRWTIGGYLQHAQGEGDVQARGADVLDVAELGASWRLSTRIRVYAAYYRWRLDDESARTRDGAVVLAGIRAAL
jgi:hypothetical protein